VAVDVPLDMAHTGFVTREDPTKSQHKIQNYILDLDNTKRSKLTKIDGLHTFQNVFVWWIVGWVNLLET
jgi:hypothetical protein